MTIHCKNCQQHLGDFLLDPKAVPASAAAHMNSCSACQKELKDLRDTMAVMDAWTAPEPSAFFDTRLYARLRTEQAAAPAGLWERLTSYVRYSTGRGLRPAMAGALGLAMLLGGGTAATLLHHGSTSVASPTVNDLKIYDNNAQALDQMDLLDDPSDDAPQS